MRTTQAQWSGHSIRPAANAAVNAAAIGSAIRVPAGIPPRAGPAAVTTWAAGGLRTRPIWCATHISCVPRATATSAPAVLPDRPTSPR
ncbi:hypothetical protein [Streptomyces sp. NPDC094472]|uniref:hypothetical protein n=1 Tax=Streptomyces sp. NPDC094472 TaxID=3155080 RepID=UPI0033174A48